MLSIGRLCTTPDNMLAACLVGKVLQVHEMTKQPANELQKIIEEQVLPKTYFCHEPLCECHDFLPVLFLCCCVLPHVKPTILWYLLLLYKVTCLSKSLFSVTQCKNHCDCNELYRNVHRQKVTCLQGRRRGGHDRGIASCPFKRGEVPFHNSTIGHLMVFQNRLETNLLQPFAHPENSEWFSI